MKSRLTLLLFALPLLGACGASDTPAAATPATSAPVSSAAVAGTPAAVTPSTASLSAQGNAPVAGTDYVELPQGAPYAPLDGQVEVAEVFGYICVHCANFEPLLDAWKAVLPAGVRVTPVPAAFGGYWNTYAKVFYAAEQLGVRESSHRAMFNALHGQHSLRPDSTPEQIGAFYAPYGVDAKTFAKTMQEPTVGAKVDHARQFAERSRVESTPSLIINGKYLVPVDERGYEHMLRTASFLVAQQQAASK